MRMGVKALVIAALYAALTMTPPLNAISYGPIQVRVADALIMLSSISYFGFEAVVGVTVGCAIANTISMYGPPDIVVGTAANFISSSIIYLMTLKRRNTWVRIASGIIASLIIAVMIGYIILHIVAGIPSPHILIASVLIGELISIVILGVIVAEAIERRMKYRVQV